MSEAVVLAKVTCRQCGATFNLRWDDDTIRPVPCPLDGGATIVKVRNNKTGVWEVVESVAAKDAEPDAEPAPEPEPAPDREEHPQ